MDWVRATLSDFLLHLAARISAPEPTETPPPVSRQPQSAGQSPNQHTGGGGPQMAAADDPPPEDFSGFRIILECRLPDGCWQFVSMEMLSERARRQLLAFAQISPAERQAVVDYISDIPLPDLDQPTVVH